MPPVVANTPPTFVQSMGRGLGPFSRHPAHWHKRSWEAHKKIDKPHAASLRLPDNDAIDARVRLDLQQQLFALARLHPRVQRHRHRDLARPPTRNKLAHLGPHTESEIFRITLHTLLIGVG